MIRAAVPVLLLAALLAGPSPAAAEGPAPPDLKAIEALALEWFRAPDEAGRFAVEEKARAVPALPADAVKPIADRIFALAAKHGLRLERKGRDTLYPPPADPAERKKAKDSDLGLYLLNPGRQGGGLLVAMHGGGENSGDAGSAQGVFAGATSLGWTVVSPQAIHLVSSAWNTEEGERFVLDLVDAARRTFDVDPDRVYLAGHSMGGDGSWMLGGRNADRIAAAAPLAGSVMPYMAPGKLNRLSTPRSDYQGLEEGVLPNLLHMHTWIYHSADDPNEAVHPDDIAVERLKALQARFPGGYDFVYDRALNMKHALPKGGVKPILQWMAKFQRNAHPKEVVWETKRAWKERMHWLWCRGHADAWPWRFHARITGPNRVEVTGTTKPTAGYTTPKEMPLTILLEPELFDLDRPITVVSGGKTLFEGPVTRSFWAILVSIARRNDPKQWYQGAVDVKVPRLMWWDLWDDPPK